MTKELIDRLRAMYVANGTNYVQAAADKLEAQAERIKELEAEIITRASYGDEQTDFAIKLAAERDALRAQLAAIEKQEPTNSYDLAKRADNGGQP